ncbi:hypothetical protein FKG94_17895 [Exilibacterium tricleocarpae]|uniref:Phage late control D family protein n=1 Tax=Exilibacterium tricleocarpae TaxID=2591008 RepID=A0A545T5X0_9GAMM|nr:contractile injection system protein, VgrG/Pvc8 family [Exilibacterium tricleocarpae]TQV72575.1 hypothetical protein FKG94_17895 [Exilibacterium tricleocarpae]
MGRLMRSLALSLPGLLDSNSSPCYRLLAGDKAVGDALQSRLISLHLHLYDGEQSDQLVLELDDGPHQLAQRLAVPKTGKKLTLWLGDTTAQTLMGDYHVDQIKGGADEASSLTITAVPKLLIRETTRTWAAMALGDIVETIAAEHSLKPKVSRRLAALRIEAENQIAESDIRFLTRLATRFDAVVKPAGGSLLFLEKGRAQTAGGAPLAPVLIKPDDIVDWSGYIASDRSAYGAVVASWHDRLRAAHRPVVAGTKGKAETFYLPHLYTGEADARMAAEAKLEALHRDTASLELKVLGKPAISAGGAIAVTGLHAEMNGEWRVKAATHTLDGSGYLTALHCYKGTRP